jgi:hypothetical protein
MVGVFSVFPLMHAAIAQAPGPSFADLQECIQKLDPASPSRASLESENFVEIPTRSDADPAGVYLISGDEAYFVPRAATAIVRFDAGSGPRYLELGAAFSTLTDGVSVRVLQACRVGDPSCKLGRKLSKSYSPEETRCTREKAVEMMSKSIEVLIPRAVEKYLKDWNRRADHQGLSGEVRKGRLAGAVMGLGQGLAACRRALPQLETLIRTEEGALAIHAATQINEKTGKGVCADCPPAN